MSQIIDELNSLAERLGADGYPTATIERAAARMKMLEDYIVDLHREFFPENVPQPSEKET